MDRRADRSSGREKRLSDFRAIQEGYISVTPLHLDLTHHAMLASAETWWQAPLEQRVFARSAAATR